MSTSNIDTQLDRLIKQASATSRFTDLSIVLRRLSILPHIAPGARLTDSEGRLWIAGDVRDGVQPVSSATPGDSKKCSAGLKLTTSAVETFLQVDEILRCGGVWDNLKKDWKLTPTGERVPAAKPVIVDLQESQIDAAKWFAERLLAFRRREKHPHCVGLLLDDRRGGKSYICDVFVHCFAVDTPTINGAPTEVWVVCQSHPARDELDEYTKGLIPQGAKGWAHYREMPKRMWQYIHGSKVHMKTTDDPESLRVGKVDMCFMNEAALLPENAYEIALRGTQDHRGFMLLASNRPKRMKGRWVIRLWEGAEKDERAGIPPSVKRLRVPPALNTAIDQGAKEGIARAIMYARDTDDESELDEGLILEAGRKLLSPPWDDNLHIRPIPDIGLVDVTAEVIRKCYGGKPFEYIAGADFQQQCASSVYKLLAPGGDISQWQMWCVAAFFLTDKDNGDEDSLCDVMISTGYTPDKVFIIADASGNWQNGRHDLGTVSMHRLRARGYTVEGPTIKKTERARFAKNPDKEASIMRFRKQIAEGRYYVVNKAEALKMAIAAKRCDAGLDSYDNLRPRGKWAHLVDTARYPQWFIAERLRAAGIGETKALKSI